MSYVIRVRGKNLSKFSGNHLGKSQEAEGGTPKNLYGKTLWKWVFLELSP